MPGEHDHLIVYFNGAFVPWAEAGVQVFSPLVKYGAGVFEGIRGYWSERRGQNAALFRLREHMERLELSQRIMRFEEDGARGRDVRGDAGARCGETVSGTSVHIRPTVYVGGAGGSAARGPIGTFITADSRGALRHGFATAARLRSRPGNGSTTGRCRPGQRRAPTTTTPASPPSRPASTDTTPPFMLNRRGKVSEGQGMCVFLVRDGVAVTPSITSGILESITRDTVLTLLRDHGDRDRRSATSTAASSSPHRRRSSAARAWEITPINAVDGSLRSGAGRPGEITRRLQKVYFDLVEGRVRRSPGLDLGGVARDVRWRRRSSTGPRIDRGSHPAAWRSRRSQSESGTDASRDQGAPCPPPYSLVCAGSPVGQVFRTRPGRFPLAMDGTSRCRWSGWRRNRRPGQADSRRQQVDLREQLDEVAGPRRTRLHEVLAGCPVRVAGAHEHVHHVVHVASPPRPAAGSVAPARARVRFEWQQR